MCDNAKETCPVFLGKVKERLNIGFGDPVAAESSEGDIVNFYGIIKVGTEASFRELYEQKARLPKVCLYIWESPFGAE